MSRPETTFDKPEFALIADTHERDYANVPNTVTAHRDGRVRRVAVVVPTAMFTLMRDVFKIEPEEKVSMYLVQDGNYFVFGIGWGLKDTGIADLWAYTKDSLPTCFK